MESIRIWSFSSPFFSTFRLDMERSSVSQLRSQLRSKLKISPLHAFTVLGEIFVRLNPGTMYFNSGKTPSDTKFYFWKEKTQLTFY